MQFITALLALTAATAVTALPDVMSNDWTNAGLCSSKNSQIVAAVDEFCTKMNIVVPSSYAKTGLGKGDVHVSITGDCLPLQWVPGQWCRAQFHGICAKSKHGFGKKSYGEGGCQHFKIEKVATLGY